MKYWNKFFLLKTLKLVWVYYQSQSPSNQAYWWNFGGLFMYFLVVQVLTVFFLTMYYFIFIFHLDISWCIYIMKLSYDLFIRYLHVNGILLCFFCVYIYMLKILSYRSFMYSYQLLWSIEIILFILIIATAFLEYILPWGQMSFWVAMVITNLIATIPYIGNDIVELLWNEFSINDVILYKFYILFIFILFLSIIYIFISSILFKNEILNNKVLKVSLNNFKFTKNYYIESKIFKRYIKIWAPISSNNKVQLGFINNRIFGDKNRCMTFLSWQEGFLANNTYFEVDYGIKCQNQSFLHHGFFGNGVFLPLAAGWKIRGINFKYRPRIMPYTVEEICLTNKIIETEEYFDPITQYDQFIKKYFIDKENYLIRHRSRGWIPEEIGKAMILSKYTSKVHPSLIPHIIELSSNSGFHERFKYLIDLEEIKNSENILNRLLTSPSHPYLELSQIIPFQQYQQIEDLYNFLEKKDKLSDIKKRILWYDEFWKD